MLLLPAGVTARRFAVVHTFTGYMRSMLHRAAGQAASQHLHTCASVGRPTLWPVQYIHHLATRSTLLPSGCCRQLSTSRTVAAAAKSKSNAPPGWQCSKCGAVYYQPMGKCSNCQQFGTIEKAAEPVPELVGSSGAVAAAKALRSAVGPASNSTTASSRARRSSSARSSFMEDYSYMDGDLSEDGSYGYTYGPDALAAAAGGVGGWVQGGGGQPRRLADIRPTVSVPRLQLPGPAGQEMSRVLGGGVVPGSMVLIGGDPGVGKSTLLLQVAALLAQTCQAGSGAPPKPSAAKSRGNGSGKSPAPVAGGRATTHPEEEEEEDDEEEEDWEGAGEAGGRPVLYVSAEETAGQVADRAARLGVDMGRLPLYLATSSNMVEVLGQVAGLRPAALVLDSIQTVMLPMDSAMGSVKQVKECTHALLRVAKETNTAVFLISHVTKDGSLAGPQTLMHMVDVVLYLEGEAGTPERLLRAEKNRFGRVGEVGLFTMAPGGLDILADPSGALLSDPAEEGAGGGGGSSHLGSALTVVLEGVRPRTVEIQALCSTNDDSGDEEGGGGEEEGLGPPQQQQRRGAAEPRLYPVHRAVGLEDKERLIMLLDILSANTRIKSRKFGLWVSPVKGYKLGKAQAGADLAILAAVVSSYANVPLPPRTVLIGEVRLNGRIAEVRDLEARLYEAAKVGASQALIPERNHCKLTSADLAGMQLVPVATLQDALVHLFGAGVVLPRGRRAPRRGSGGAAVGQLAGTWRAPQRSTSSRGYSTGAGNGAGGRE